MKAQMYKIVLFLTLQCMAVLGFADQIDEAKKVESDEVRIQRENVVKNYVKSLNTKDISIIKSMYAKDATVSDPWGTEPKVGYDAIVKFYAEGAYHEKAQLSAELTGPIRVAGDSAAFSFNVFFNGMKLEVIDVFEFNEEGKVQVMKAYWSNANITPMK